MRMLKLLIVDDESTTRNGLKKALNWQEFHINEIREAVNGQDALDILGTYEADIVLTDIRMPFMTGVELAQVLVEQYPKVKIIFLSAYSDKEYLKSAIHFGVVNYVEKPIDLEELSAAVLKAVQMCHQTIEVETIKQRSGISKKTMMENLIRHSQNYVEVQEQIALFSPELLKQTNYTVMVFRVKSGVDSLELLQKFEKVLDEKSVQSSEDRIILSVIKDDLHLLTILGWKKESSYLNQINELQELIREEVWKENVYLAIGSEVKKIEELYLSYQGAVIALQGLFMNGFGNLIKYHEGLFNQNVNFQEEEILQKFREACQGFDKERILNFICQFYQGLKFEKKYFTNELKNLSVNLYHEIYREAEKQRAFQKTEVMEEELRYYWEQIFRFETFEELRNFIIGKIEKLLQEIEWCSRYSKTIRLVMQSIDLHFVESDLSTNRLAAEVYLTDAYLSTLFKKEVGITISRYIQNVRMEKAKELLKDKSLNIAEISERVGYTDSNYFAKTFRKIYGKAPSDFRERMW
ncbi:MAG: response regulator [Vallitaleaceae bacterium]|nr:response regulator [Vallitaleaceae bacterium]